MVSTKIKQLYDEVFYAFWCMTMGTATEKREVYVAAKLFAQYVRSELRRRYELDLAGETALQARGLTPPDSVINAWIINTLEDCRRHKIPPPQELIATIYQALDCTHWEEQRGEKNKLKRESVKVFASVQKSRDENAPGVRELARKHDVAPSSITRWIREAGENQFTDQEWQDAYSRAAVFYPAMTRILKKKSKLSPKKVDSER